MPTSNAFAPSLARLRRRSERNMPLRAVISRPAVSDDGAGGRVTVLTQIATDVHCRIETVELVDVQNISALGLTGSETARIAERKTWRICFPWSTAVERDDIVVIDGVTYDIMDKFDRATNEPHLTTLGMEEVS